MLLATRSQALALRPSGFTLKLPTDKELAALRWNHAVIGLQDQCSPNMGSHVYFWRRWSTPSFLSQAIRGTLDAHRSSVQHMSIDHCRAQVGVA